MKPIPNTITEYPGRPRPDKAEAIHSYLPGNYTQEAMAQRAMIAADLLANRKAPNSERAAALQFLNTVYAAITIEETVTQQGWTADLYGSANDRLSDLTDL